MVHMAVYRFHHWCTLRCEGFSNWAHEGVKVLAGCTCSCEGLSNGAHEGVKVSAVVHMKV